MTFRIIRGLIDGQEDTSLTTPDMATVSTACVAVGILVSITRQRLEGVIYPNLVVTTRRSHCAMAKGPLKDYNVCTPNVHNFKIIMLFNYIHTYLVLWVLHLCCAHTLSYRAPTRSPRVTRVHPLRRDGRLRTLNACTANEIDAKKKIITPTYTPQNKKWREATEPTMS